MGKVAESTQKKNLNLLHKVHKGNGNEILGEGSISIEQKKEDTKTSKNAMFELGINRIPQRAYIQVECEPLEFKQRYYLDEITLRYEEFKDFQFTTRYFKIIPKGSKMKIEIKLK